MKKQFDSRVRKDHNRMFIAAVVVLATLILISIMNARLAKQYPNGSPVTTQITPVVVEANRSGWKKFFHPSYNFTFMYPETWKVALTKSSEREREYSLILIYREGDRDYRIDFMRGGRGTAQFDSVTRDTKAYGNNTAYVSTYLRRNTPVEQVITFRDPEILSPYIAIDVHLPAKNLTQHMKVIDQFASTIKRVR